MSGRGRRRMFPWVAAVTAVVALGLLGAGCGEEEPVTPLAPDVSRAQPTGTVTTTIPDAGG